MTHTVTKKKTRAKGSRTPKLSRRPTTKLADAYLTFVEWSDEDNLYIGRCPDLFLGGCHGPDPVKVYAELRLIVEDWIDYFTDHGQALPPVKLQIPDAA